MKSKILSVNYVELHLTLWIINFFFFVSSGAVREKFRNQVTTTPADSSSDDEDFVTRTYRPILHSQSAKNTNLTALKDLARIAESDNEDEEKHSRGGCPVTNVSANELTSAIPILSFIAAFAIGVFWFFVFFILYNYFSGILDSDSSGNRSYDGESLGNLIKSAANGFIYTPEFNKLTDLILASISKLY